MTGGDRKIERYCKYPDCRRPIKFKSWGDTCAKCIWRDLPDSRIPIQERNKYSLLNYLS